MKKTVGDRSTMVAQKKLVIDESRCRGCRTCQLACSIKKYGVFNPSKAFIRIERNIETGRTCPVVLSGCDMCGGNFLCAELCPYGAIVNEVIEA